MYRSYAADAAAAQLRLYYQSHYPDQQAAECIPELTQTVGMCVYCGAASVVLM
jgi:hypothetical protein